MRRKTENMSHEIFTSSPLRVVNRARNRIVFISVLIGGSLVRFFVDNIVFLGNLRKFLAPKIQIYWHWEAMLISFLQVRKTVLPFNSLEDLYENTKFKASLKNEI